MVARKSGNHSQNCKDQTDKILHDMTTQIEDVVVVIARFSEQHIELRFLAEISLAAFVGPWVAGQNMYQMVDEEQPEAID